MQSRIYKAFLSFMASPCDAFCHPSVETRLKTLQERQRLPPSSLPKCGGTEMIQDKRANVENWKNRKTEQHEMSNHIFKELFTIFP